jgi:hypothetical protein
VSGEIEVGGMHWVKDRRDRWISDEDDAALATEAAMLDEIERLRAAGDVLAHVMPHAHLGVPCRPPQGTPLDEWCSQCAALVAWKEASRER